jgi:hypothetical protein
MTYHVQHAHHGMPMLWANEEKLVLLIFDLLGPRLTIPP